jgi:DNA recombination protein RmuC
MQAQEQLKNAFKAVSSDVLRESQRSFFEVAKEIFQKQEALMEGKLSKKEGVISEMVKPLKESLEKVDGKIAELEKARVGAYVGITEQLKALSASQIQLQQEASYLSKALRLPSARGAWGEMQLRRVIELAGMVEYCDFETQVTMEHNERKIRPDVVIKLPNLRSIVIDAKAPLQAYLEAVEMHDASLRDQRLQEHAKHLRKHLSILGEKSYWEQFQRAPEFVVLFLPAESFFSMALEQDPSLIEFGVERQVLVATPTTLIALLKAVACGWREELIQEHAEYISNLGRQLYDRLQTLIEHFQKLKRALDTTVDSYNKVTACFEGRVLVAARRFQEVGVGTQQPAFDELEPVEKLARDLIEDKTT